VQIAGHSQERGVTWLSAGAEEYALGKLWQNKGTFITVARLLWGFQFDPALDEHGNEIPVDIFNYTNGLNMRPQLFKVRISPRNEEIRRTIELEGKQALEDLVMYEGETQYRMSEFYKSWHGHLVLEETWLPFFNSKVRLEWAFRPSFINAATGIESLHQVDGASNISERGRYGK